MFGLNISDSEEYLEHKSKLSDFCINENDLNMDKEIIFEDFKLIIKKYKTGKNSWDVSRGLVYKGDKLICDIKRNYSVFLHKFHKHSNGKTYLLTGEDYQGYTVVDLTTGNVFNYVPEQWKFGAGFCFTDFTSIHTNNSKETLKVEGCYWGAGFECLELDFSNPEKMPYSVLSRHDAE